MRKLWGRIGRCRGRQAALLALLLPLLLAGCGGAAAPAGLAPPLPAPPPVVAVLVGGDASVPAFDDAASYLHDRLARRGVPQSRLHLLLAGATRPPGTGTASLASVLTAIGALRPTPGETCLVYLTSHGGYGRGIRLVDGEALRPAALDRSLQTGCGGAPTVVVASACYSGQFAAPPMRRPNRIILTAARADRGSIGCSAGASFTFFDECLLGALPNAPTWREIARRTRGCVAHREQALDLDPSEPQSFFGAEVTDLAGPLPASPGSDPTAIRFAASEAHFAPSLIPFGRAERARLMPMLEHYAAAPPPKALALLPSGLVVWSSAGPGESADDVARQVLQHCEWLSGGACILFARDDRMIELLPCGLPPLHPEILLRDGPVQADTVPFIRADERQEISSYLALRGPKALALDPGYSGGFGIGEGASLAAARDAALARCDGGGRDCVLYAEDGRAVLGWKE